MSKIPVDSNVARNWFTICFANSKNGIALHSEYGMVIITEISFDANGGNAIDAIIINDSGNAIFGKNLPLTRSARDGDVYAFVEHDISRFTFIRKGL